LSYESSFLPATMTEAMQITRKVKRMGLMQDAILFLKFDIYTLLQ